MFMLKSFSGPYQSPRNEETKETETLNPTLNPKIERDPDAASSPLKTNPKTLKPYTLNPKTLNREA